MRSGGQGKKTILEHLSRQTGEREGRSRKNSIKGEKGGGNGVFGQLQKRLFPRSKKLGFD